MISKCSFIPYERYLTIFWGNIPCLIEHYLSLNITHLSLQHKKMEYIYNAFLKLGRKQTRKFDWEGIII